MAALTAYAAGLSTTGLEILSKALFEVFGEVSLEELGKDNLRYSVRMSMKSSSIVLVVLDGSSQEACKDIENGLYSSDKYALYTDDKGLTSFLNEKYGLSLEMPVDVEDIELEEPEKEVGVSSKEMADLRESYEAQLADKDGLIKTLQSHIKSLQQAIDDDGYPEDAVEVESLKDENVSLRSELSDVKTELEGIKAMGIHSDEEFEELRGNFITLQGKYDSLKTEYNKVSQECTEAQMDGSRKSGVLRDKEAEIKRLSSQIEGLSAFVAQHQDCESKIAELKTEIVGLKQQIEGLQTEINEKKGEISRLQTELTTSGKTQEQLEEYKELLLTEQSRCADLTKKLSKAEGDLAKSTEDLDKLISEKQKLEGDLATSQSKIQEYDSYITELNAKNVELNGKVRVLEQSTSRDYNMEETLSELAQTRRKLVELQGNVFNTLYAKAMPKSANRATLFNAMGIRYDNIRFVFSGSTESRKGTYKCLLNEIRQSGNKEKYLLVDVVSETYVDYVFEIRNLVNGLKWFTDGGGVQKYVTPTCVSNVRVLSPGLGYINDSFYLTVNWERRLQELEMSGYKVILYCGDLSNVIGRVLFENFADVGKADIYVHGNSVGSRTILGVSRGISNIGRATVKYFEYDPHVSKFVEHMKQKCACEVVSSVSR